MGLGLGLGLGLVGCGLGLGLGLVGCGLGLGLGLGLVGCGLGLGLVGLWPRNIPDLNLQSLEHRRLLSDLVMCYNIVHGCCALRFDEFFTFSTNPVTRGHSLKLSVPLCKSNIRKNFFAVRVVPIWNSLPQQIVSANSPAAFKNQISKYDFSLFLNFPCVL